MDFEKLYLYNKDIRDAECFSYIDYLKKIDEKTRDKHNANFLKNNDLKYKDYIITILGYTNKKRKHTNWFPWNRFNDVFKTIGYQVEWCEINNIKRNGEKRLFITWNEPTCFELIKHPNFNKDNDIIFQKLTSLGKYDGGENWTKNAHEWCIKWKWTMYKMLYYCYENGYNIYGFGCRTNYKDYPIKRKICEKMKDRIFWISWGGTPFDLKQILKAKPLINNLNKNCGFVGSKWGIIGRGNIDAWDKYLEPLNKHKFESYGGIGRKLLTDDEMVKVLQQYKVCPIIHAPSWQAEQGIQDRFYTVFISGRFGICDNLGAIKIFGKEIQDICTTNPKEYYEKTLYYIDNIDEQVKYIKFIQKKIKKKYNFYIQWYNVMCGKHNF